MAYAPTSRVKVAEDVLFRQVGEEAVLLNLKTELYLGLDAVGARMWQLLTEGASIGAAYDQLLQEYDVDPARLQSDLDGFLNKLSEQYLIEVVPSEPTASGASQ